MINTEFVKVPKQKVFSHTHKKHSFDLNYEQHFYKNTSSAYFYWLIQSNPEDSKYQMDSNVSKKLNTEQKREKMLLSKVRS